MAGKPSKAVDSKMRKDDWFIDRANAATYMVSSRQGREPDRKGMNFIRNEVLRGATGTPKDMKEA